MKRHTTVRLDKKTDEVLKRLAELYGSQTNAIAIAIDRLAREELVEEKAEIKTLDKIIHFTSGHKHKQLDETTFLRYYEPDATYCLNTKRADGYWHYWQSKQSGKQVRVNQVH